MKSISNVVAMPIAGLKPDESNPRKPDQARMALLRLSIQKLGFIMPVYATAEGMLLSGHQRLTVATGLGLTTIPTVIVSLKEDDIKGINIIFNRATNDFTAFDTGSNSSGKLHYADVLAAADELPDFEGEDFHALRAVERPIKGIGSSEAHRYDKKAAVMAEVMRKLKIRIPVVISESGQIVNGIHRLFSAKEAGEATWPIVTIPDAMAEMALTFLNYLSMDFHVDDEFADVLRYSAFRRCQCVLRRLLAQVPGLARAGTT